jgi:hypothetical protein
MVDPNRTLSGHECRYTGAERRALESLVATAQVPLVAHICTVQEGTLENLAKVRSDQRELVWLQYQTYHSDLFRGYAPESLIAAGRGEHERLRFECASLAQGDLD